MPDTDYAETIALIERLHRRFLDVLRVELERLGVDQINNVQSLLLANIGAEEVSVGELMSRGYYLGSNVTYNLKRLVEAGFVEQQRSRHDRRVVRVRLSARGHALCADDQCDADAPRRRARRPPGSRPARSAQPQAQEPGGLLDRADQPAGRLSIR